LKLAGKKVVMNYVGSDIRLRSVEIKRHQYFHLRPEVIKEKSYYELLKRIQLHWHAIWCDFCIAPRNLYAHAKEIYPERKIIKNIWTTNTITVPEKIKKKPESKIPVVLHAPTNLEKKGTYYVNQAINSLKEKGISFEYFLAIKIPHHEFIEILKNKADIIVDSVLGGGFGNLAMEAMAYGKPVCGYVIEEIRDSIPDLPVVQCTIETLEERITWLIENPDKRNMIGIAGHEFAKKHYDRNTIGEELWALYMSLF